MQEAMEQPASALVSPLRGVRSARGAFLHLLQNVEGLEIIRDLFLPYAREEPDRLNTILRQGLFSKNKRAFFVFFVRLYESMGENLFGYPPFASMTTWQGCSCDELRADSDASVHCRGLTGGQLKDVYVVDAATSTGRSIVCLVVSDRWGNRQWKETEFTLHADDVMCKVGNNGNGASLPLTLFLGDEPRLTGVDGGIDYLRIFDSAAKILLAVDPLRRLTTPPSSPPPPPPPADDDIFASVAGLDIDLEDEGVAIGDVTEKGGSDPRRLTTPPPAKRARRDDGDIFSSGLEEGVAIGDVTEKGGSGIDDDIAAMLLEWKQNGVDWSQLFPSLE